MTTTPEYVALLTSEHNTRPRFVATVQATVAPLAGLQALLKGLVDQFDIDNEDPVTGCVGRQLDILGLWIGRSRRVAVPITGVFFTWDDTAGDGWDAGRWQGEFESGTAAVFMPDPLYRQVLRGKIAANNWHGNKDGQYHTLLRAFGAAGQILIVDNQDMTQTVLVAAGFLTPTQQAVLEQQLVPIKPEGVRINYDSFFLPQYELDVFLSGPVPDALRLLETTILGTGVAFAPDSFVVCTAETPFTAERVFTWSYKLPGGEWTAFCTMTFDASGPGASLATIAMADAALLPVGSMIALDGPATGGGGGTDIAVNVLGEYLVGA